MTRRSVSLPGTLLLCFWTLPAFAQESAPTEQPATDPPAHISVVDGTALLERDGRTDTELLSMPLLAGDRVRTQAGRVEVLFADGSALHLDEQTMVDFQSDEVVRLLGGRVRLSVSRPARDIAYRIDAPSAWVQINNPGEYRVSVLRGDEVELAVLRGGAELVNEQGRSYVSAGERTYARLQAAPSPAYVFNSAAWDSFDRWSESRRDQRLGVSAQYLPEDVRRYAPAFDTYGSWRHEPAYGYVSVPPRPGWLASVLSRPLGEPAAVRLDLDCERPLGMADASLWPVGNLRRLLVLDSRAIVGASVGLLGLRTGLRELVSARLEQQAGPRLLGELLRRTALRPVVRVVCAAARSLQRRPTCTCRAIRRCASTRGCTVPSWSTTADLTCTLPSIVRECRSAPRAARRPGGGRDTALPVTPAARAYPRLPPEHATASDASLPALVRLALPSTTRRPTAPRFAAATTAAACHARGPDDPVMRMPRR